VLNKLYDDIQNIRRETQREGSPLAGVDLHDLTTGGTHPQTGNASTRSPTWKGMADPRKPAASPAARWPEPGCGSRR
jgi:hypothetical protein